MRAQTQLEQALADLYAICLFETVENNPFSQAATLARQAFAPGVSGFVESSLAAIPLTPPSLEAEYTQDGIVNVVTGFTPIYTESSATVGEGLFLVGTNASFFNLSKIRGEDLDALSFVFQQDGGGDQIVVSMPLDISAQVFTLHGTYGVTDRFDIGFALPIVSLGIDNVNTTFRVEGDNTGCRYSPNGLNCEGQGTRDVSPPLFNFTESEPERETFVETLALRAKYRFPVSVRTGRIAAVVDVRLPFRSEDNVLGSGNFGTRLTFIGEYNQLNTFQPYINFGAQFWNGANSNSLNIATGFNQQLAPDLFFAFDLLGKIDLESDPFLAPIGGALDPDASTRGSALVDTSIPVVNRDHTLNAGLGLQFAVSSSIHAYGSALFALASRGLQSTVAPTVGVTAYF
ncbi:MAG: hypothetical protein GVY12_06605 [Bacteroidetes bacterium]|nr:hypothetical protein [Bacteroidota bacterium]